MLRVLVIGQDRDRDYLLKLVGHAVWFDINGDIAELPDNVASIIVDVPLDNSATVRRLGKLLDILRPELPKLFVLNKAHRIEVVRATVFGATRIHNRPLHADDLQDFFRRDTSLSAQSQNGAGESVALATASLSRILDAVMVGETIAFDTIGSASDSIAVSLHADGLENWLRTVRDHHQGTLQHSLIVAGVMTRFGQRLGMSQADVAKLTRIGLLHDVGKAMIPVELLDKPGKLTEEEFGIIKTHPYQGFKFLMKQKVLTTDELAAVVGHHEYLDGSGYPYGLLDKSIGDLVRITTVCDIYSALIERRSYKPEMSPEDALEIVNKLADDGKIERSLVKALRRSLD